MKAGQVHRVLVRTGSRVEGASIVETFEYVDATPEQALAYANSDPNWRAAGAGTGGWFARTFRRIFG